MREIAKEVIELWPEIGWINNIELRHKTAMVWQRALEKSVLKPQDLKRIPFTLLCGPDLKVSFMDHKRAVVHIARDSGNKMNEFFGEELPVDMDVLISGAILAAFQLRVLDALNGRCCFSIRGSERIGLHQH